MTKYIISIIAGFIDIINYYPNGNSPYPLYGDGSEPFSISFSLFNFIIVYYLCYCVELLIKIKNGGIYITEDLEEDEANK